LGFELQKNQIFMKFPTLRQHIKLLQILLSEESIVIRDLEQRTGIKYNTLNTTLNKWVKSNDLKKTLNEPLLLGGDKYRYSLTNKAIISLIKDLQENLDLRYSKNIKEKAIELKEILPQFLRELEINLNEKQIKTLQTKIVQVFKEFDNL